MTELTMIDKITELEKRCEHLQRELETERLERTLRHAAWLEELEARVKWQDRAINAETENARLLAIAGAQDLYAHDDSPYKRVEVNQKFHWGED
jgi:hypothetical protein